MSGISVNLSAVAAVAIPSQVIWSYSIGGAIFVIGLAVIFRRGDWQKARGLDKLVLLGPIFYAAPLAAFGTEHFTFHSIIASMVPKFIPGHAFWAYFIGGCFIAAALSMVTGIQSRLAASLLALNFFLFVALMDAPGWVQDPKNRITLALMLRELSFGAGALALAASLSKQWPTGLARLQATIARYFIGVAVVFYSFEQFLHANYVPGVPLNRVMPDYIYGHALWTYLAAVAYAIGGILLLVGKKARWAASGVGFTVLLVELVVYVPIGVVDRARVDLGLNYVFDTLMFCGAVLLLARAMPREQEQASAAAELASKNPAMVR